MIKLFRKIRQNLLSEGKNRKYLKYAIGEIILVVIGILIALQINLKSQEKTNRNNIESILKSAFVNLENDIVHPINTYIQGFNIKDSIGNLILSKTLSLADYKEKIPQYGGLANHLIYEFEPFQFQRQAYDRLMANIENIPEDYVPIVNLLQDVYSKEVPVVNEVALELKNFIDEIEDKYQNRYEWYSNADSTHFKQKVAYMMGDPLYLNDVKRHQKIADHLKRHLAALKMQISIAYSRMYDQFNDNHPFPDSMEQFTFPSKKELDEYAGMYRTEDGSDIVLRAKDYYLTGKRGNFKFVQTKNKFLPIVDPSRGYMEFVRNENSVVNALKIYRISAANDTISKLYEKIK